MTNKYKLDLSGLDPAAADPAAGTFNEAMRSALASGGWSFPPESASALRSTMDAGADSYRSPRARTRSIVTDSSTVHARIVDAATPSAVVLHFHPGGFVFGGAAYQDAALERMADVIGATVISVDYRLAPEHPFPAGLDDCEAIARWLIENAQAEFGTDRLLITGQSAGASLAVSTLVRVHASHPGAFRAASLFYGNYDATRLPLQEDGVVIFREAMDWFYAQYVADPAQRRNPEVSPSYADLRGLPPCLLTVGSADALLDDSVLLACHMLAADVDVELQVVPGGEHGFESSGLPAAVAAVSRSDRFLLAHSRSSVVLPSVEG